MANIQPGIPRIGYKLLEAVTKGNAAEVIELLNTAQPSTTTADHVVVPITDPEAINNGGGIEEGEITSMAHGGSSPSYERVGQTIRSEGLLQGVTSDLDGVLHIAARLEHENLVREITKTWRNVVDVAAKNKSGECLALRGCCW